jgi:prepilin-type N-terminal cleavage/methylation domain-containing protein
MRPSSSRQSSPAGRESASARQRGFTLLELLVTMTMMALVFAMVVPNLGTFVPSAKLRGSGTQLLRTIDWARSEARIQARRMSIEFDLDHARWRVVHPPEMRLTRDEDERDLAEWTFNWTGLEDGVVFGGVGDARHGLATKGMYRMEFDEHGFSSDQVIAMTLSADPKVIWGLTMRGLTGTTTITESETGEQPQLAYVEEGAF